MSRSLALFTAVVFLLAILAPLAPVATAQTVVSLKTTRDEWGTIGNETYFAVEAVLTSKPGDNITLTLEYEGVPYSVLAFYVPGTAYLYRAVLYVASNGTLYYWNGTHLVEVVTLEPDKSIAIKYGDKVVVLTYKHYAAEIKALRDKVPFPVNRTGTKDWEILAPDLNKWWNDTETIVAYVEVKDYTKDKTWDAVAVFKETGKNTAAFSPASLELTKVTFNATGVTSEEFTVNNTTGTGYKAYNGTELKIEVKLDFAVERTETDFNLTLENVTVLQKLDTTTIDEVKFVVNRLVCTNKPTNSSVPCGPVTIDLKLDDIKLGELELVIDSINVTNESLTPVVDHIDATANVTLDYEYLYAWAGAEIDPGDVVDVTVKVPRYTGASTGDTATKSIEVFRYAGKIVETKATLRELYVKVEDLSENKKSYEKETLAGRVKVILPNGTEVSLDLTETGDDTGVFEAKLSDLWKYYPEAINASEPGTTNKIVVKYYDPSETEHVDEATVYVTFYKAEIVKAEPEKAATTSTIKIAIKDQDLNLDPEARDIAYATVTGDFYEVDVTTKGRTFAKLTVKAETEGGYCNYTVKAGSVPVVIAETGGDTGVFEATIDLSKFKLTGCTGEVKAIVIEYKDLLTPEGAKTVTAEIPVVKASIAVDRDVVPLSKVGPIVVHINVTDPAVNVDPYSKESISKSNITWALTDIGKKNVTSYVPVDEDAVEVDVNAGVFTTKLTIDPSVITPNVIGGYLHINYSNPATGSAAEIYVPLKVFGIELKVNETKKLVTKYGDVLSIVLVDPDANLDTEAKDTVNVIIVLPGGVEKTVTLEETGANTGVFKNESVVVKGTMFGVEVKPTETIKLKYTDEASPLTPKGAEEWVSSTAEVEVYVKSFTGELYVNGTTGKIEVGPKAVLNITVVDWDQNKDPEAKEAVDIVIKYWNGTTKTFKAEETGDSTGVFVNSSIKMSDLLAGTELSKAIGKSIYVIYRDPVDAAGSITVKQVEVVVKAWTGEVKTDKDLYKPGETIKITVVDPDQAGAGSVSVRVYSTSDPVGTTLTLVEVEPGKFMGEIKISKEPTTERGYIYAKIGDTVTIEYTDKLSATGETVTVKKTVSVGVPPEMIKYPAKVAKEEIKLVSEKGVPVAKPKVGKWAFVAVPVKNTGVTKLEAWVKVVVRDATGVVVHMAFQKIALEPGEATEVMPGWMPDKPGVYTVEVYVIKSLAEPIPLTEEPVYKVTVEVTE